ncbi:MAG: nuclear transport factor 2 family protein [Salinimicrobium sp.]
MFHQQNFESVSHFRKIFLLLAFFSFSLVQAQDSELTALLSQKDSIFWKAYNECDIPGMAQFLAKDVEFYHDKGGVTLGSDALNEGMKKGLCSGGKNAVRREAVPGTVHIYPLFDNGELYGAIMTGEHLFYPTNGNSKKPDGRAKFSHLWLKKNGEWKMHRILSYNHGPAAYENPKQEISLTAEELQQFTGRYLTAKNEPINVELVEGHLELQAMGKTFTLLPENKRSFFTKERDLSFSFSQQKPLKLTIYESTNKVEEAILDQK